MGGLAHRHVVHVQVASNRANDDLARVQTDADLHGDAGAALQVLGVVPDGFLHPKRGIARPHGVILVGERRAEQRHDPVAHDLIHRTLVTVDGLHHPFEHRVEQLASLLGVAVGDEFSRAIHIGEEDRHLLALSLEAALEVRIFSARCRGVYD
jgi:hypothetical protein